MSTHLETILAATRATVAANKERIALAELDQLAAEHQPRGWVQALRKASKKTAAIIAELKKASPSKGLIREDFDVAWLAKRYAAGGAAALSVLTDEPFFQGSLRNLELASEAVPLPCLRKDFTVDEYQIVEARAHRADAILLIAAALTDHELESFIALAHDLQLDVLCEVHDHHDLDHVLALAEPPDAIGVNTRNLRTFEVRMETALELIDAIPNTRVRIAESGITSHDDIARLRKAGFDAFLVGETLMRQPDPALALQSLLTGAPVLA
jgi:indole-3-glycerol phosphate synthase